MALLQAPTPALETLQVRNLHVDSENSPSDEFTLSEGPPLKHLSLDDITTPLNHPRLSNLITLALTGSPVPKSPEQLLHILSRLQQLEELAIKHLQNGTWEGRASAPILLPYLKKLDLSHLPSIYIATILASIYTPSCSHIVVHDWGRSEEGVEALEALDAVIWRPGNDQAALLLGSSSSRSERSGLYVQRLVQWIGVKSPMSLDGYRELEFSRVDVPRFMTQLATTISQLPSPPAVEIEVKAGGIPVALLPWGDLLKSLVVEGKDACRSVLQQLSQRHVTPGTGEVDWVCRKLAKITLIYEWDEQEDTVADGRALLSLVRQRWSSEDGFAGA
ncbi:hypothetical protein FRC00_013165, partial [Tulasnella sp. 408]